MKAFYGKVDVATLGSLWVAIAHNKLVRVGLNESKKHFLQQLPKNNSWQEVPAAKLAVAQKQIESYLAGNSIALANFELNQGTAFQQNVWKTMHTIPHGETRSYAWIAQQLGKPKAFRAVANACGANPLPIVIPCHRVIASNGKLGGFSSGLEWKKKLQRIEKISLKK